MRHARSFFFAGCAFFVVGCGGRTQGDFDFGDLDGSIDSGEDVVVDDVSTDGTRVDSGVRDGASDVIGVDVVHVDSGRVDSGRVDGAPDGIVVDVIGVDVIPFDTGVDTGSDVVEIDSGVDTGIDVGFDTGFDTGTDGGPVDGGIHCGGGGGGGTTCDPATEDCCATFTGTFSCVPKGTCGGVPLSCSSAASCPTGEICCLTPPGPGGGGSASCEATCSTIQLCATSAECPPGTRCRRLFGGYRSCR